MVRKVKHTITKTTTSHRLEVGRDSLIAWLREQGWEVDASAAVFVSIPGGGDWSNTDLDIDPANPIVVAWTIETQQEDY